MVPLFWNISILISNTCIVRVLAKSYNACNFVIIINWILVLFLKSEDCYKKKTHIGNKNKTKFTAIYCNNKLAHLVPFDLTIKTKCDVQITCNQCLSFSHTVWVTPVPDIPIAIKQQHSAISSHFLWFNTLM